MQEIHENLWDVFVLRKIRNYILYSKKTESPHIRPLNRNHMFEQRRWKSRFSGKSGLRPVKHVSKSFVLSYENLK